MPQKLSLRAKAKKEARDLAYAKTTDRKRKKAENQRKRRAAKKRGFKLAGLDYDHKTKRFTSIKANRGNRGRGTKRE
jgi:hypothetical protein|tara:strand:- start:250 stop:480 length:231 start_codon:yes stop_codon:yes gene_type:complete